MDEIALQRAPMGVAKKGTVPSLTAPLGDLGRNERLPVGAAENVVAERERVAKVVLLHDPGGAQAETLSPY